MKLFFQILTVIFLLPWPVAIMFSPMALFAAAPDKGTILLVLAIFFYPVILSTIYFLKGWPLFGLAPKYFLIGTIVVAITATVLFGLPKMIYNIANGIKADGYFITESAGYYYGDKIKEADPKTLRQMDPYYALDKEHVFYRGKIVEGADASSFELFEESSVTSGKADAKDKFRRYFRGKPL